MEFTKLTAVEAASFIKHGMNIGLSGFTPAGTPKAVTAEVAKIAAAEHAAGRPFQIGIFTGASTGMSTDGLLSDLITLISSSTPGRLILLSMSL